MQLCKVILISCFPQSFIFLTIEIAKLIKDIYIFYYINNYET